MKKQNFTLRASTESPGSLLTLAFCSINLASVVIGVPQFAGIDYRKWFGDTVALLLFCVHYFALLMGIFLLPCAAVSAVVTSFSRKLPILNKLVVWAALVIAACDWFYIENAASKIK